MVEVRITYRELESPDYPLIYNSFIKSRWGDFDKRKKLHQRNPPPRFAATNHDFLERALVNGRGLAAQVEGLIVGWMLIQPIPPTLTYVYVKRDFRGQGIARKLVSEVWQEGTEVPCACMTFAGEGFLSKIGVRMKTLPGAWA